MPPKLNNLYASPYASFELNAPFNSFLDAAFFYSESLHRTFNFSLYRRIDYLLVIRKMLNSTCFELLWKFKIFWRPVILKIIEECDNIARKATITCCSGKVNLISSKSSVYYPQLCCGVSSNSDKYDRDRSNDFNLIVKPYGRSRGCREPCTYYWKKMCLHCRTF